MTDDSVAGNPDNESAPAPAPILYSLADQRIPGRGEEMARLALERGVSLIRETPETPAAKTIRLHAETFSREQAIANGRASVGWR